MGAKEVAAAIAAPALFALAAPGSPLAPAAFVFIVPWFFAARCLAPGRLFPLSLGLWTVAWMTVFRWFPECLVRIYGMGPAAAWIATAAAAVAFYGIPSALFFTAAGLAARCLAPHSGRRGAVGAAAFFVGLPLLWAVMEIFRGRVYPSLNFNTLASFLHPCTALMAPARYVGEYGLSALAVLVNCLLFAGIVAALSRRWLTALALSGALLCAAAAFYAADIPAPAAPRGPRVAAVQVCVPHWRKWQERHMDAVMDDYMKAAAEAPVGHTVLWPETSLNFYPVKGDSRHGALVRFAGAPERTVLAGGPEYRAVPGGFVYYNTVYRITGAGIEPVYRKERLLPFTEYCPFAVFRGLYRKYYRPTEYSPGKGNAPVYVDGVPVSLAVCFESTISGHPAWREKRTNTVLLFSDDVWLGETGSLQHLASTGLRAVESGKWVVCVTNRGVPAVIDPRGATVRKIAYGRRGALVFP